MIWSGDWLAYHKPDGTWELRLYLEHDPSPDDAEWIAVVDPSNDDEIRVSRDSVVCMREVVEQKRLAECPKEVVALIAITQATMSMEITRQFWDND